MTKRRAEEDAVFWDAAGTTSTNNNYKKKSCCGGSSASFCGVDAQLDGVARMLDPPSLLLAVLGGSRCRKRLNDNDGDCTPEQHEGPARQRRKTPSRADNCSVLQQQQTCASFPGGVLHSSSITTTSDHHNKRLRPDDDDDDGDVSPRTTKSRNDGVGDADSTRDLCTFNSFQYWRVPLPEIDQSLFDDMNSQSEARAKPKDKNCSPPDAMET